MSAGKTLLEGKARGSTVSREFIDSGIRHKRADEFISPPVTHNAQAGDRIVDIVAVRAWQIARPEGPDRVRQALAAAHDAVESPRATLQCTM